MIDKNFGLSDNAVHIFKNLYSFTGENIEETFKRVSKEFSKNEDDEKLAFNLLANGIWRPNTPVFLNAGTKHKVFSACYVCSLFDSMESIYDIANVCRKIFQFGSGVGIPIGNLREKEAYIYEGDIDSIPEGRSSGPIVFMKLFDAVGETTKSGGRVRRAAILCTMPVWHPDIIDFIECKKEDGRLANMNISVGVTNKFMKALEDGISFDLISPRDGKKVGEIDPQVIWDKLAKNAHHTADPGVLFLDTINKYNVLKEKYLIEAVNPCGEQILIGFGSCNLSAVNITKFIRKDNTFDWNSLYNTTFDIAGLMDNLIDVMDFPDDRFKDIALKYRPIGIGPMGLADAMYILGLRYNGIDGRQFASEVMRIMTISSIHKSTLIAKEYGAFYDYNVFEDDMKEILFEHIGEGYEEVKELVRKHGVRNCQYTTSMPTGTTALSCDASYGTEPLFGLVFEKNLISGEKMVITNPIFKQKYENEKWFTENLPERILKNNGSLKGLKGIPKEVREVFVVAHDIKYKDRVDMLSEIQKHCSTAISQTINLPRDTSVEEISDIYKYSYEKGLKGVTVYRDGSKKGQPVTFKSNKMIMSDFIRPSRLSSNTFKMETGNGKMYVTISDYEGKPIEVFLSLGKSGQVPNTFTESLGRVISISLQNGVPVEEITKTLKGINSDNPMWHRFEPSDKKPTQILSIPDGISKLLEKYYSGQQYDGELGESCPKCGSLLQHIEGCESCASCGYNKCS